MKQQLQMPAISYEDGTVLLRSEAPAARFDVQKCTAISNSDPGVISQFPAAGRCENFVGELSS